MYTIKAEIFQILVTETVCVVRNYSSAIKGKTANTLNLETEIYEGCSTILLANS